MRLPVRLVTKTLKLLLAFETKELLGLFVTEMTTFPRVDGRQVHVATKEPFVGRFLQPGITFPRS